jgi:hypothetical protein
MRNLRAQHVGHAIGHGPHALADLRPAGKTHRKADLHVALLVVADPGLGLHLFLGQHGAGFHAGVDLVAGAVEEAGVDEHDAVPRGGDAGGQIGAGAALFIHHAHLHGVAGQA